MEYSKQPASKGSLHSGAICYVVTRSSPDQSMADSLGGAVTFVLAKCLVTHVVVYTCVGFKTICCKTIVIKIKHIMLGKLFMKIKANQ